MLCSNTKALGASHLSHGWMVTTLVNATRFRAKATCVCDFPCSLFPSAPR